MSAPLSVEALPASEIRYATPLTTAGATTQPNRNNGPFTLARLENSIRITAMIGTGLIATPIANVSISLIPCAMSRPFQEGLRDGSRSPHVSPPAGGSSSSDSRTTDGHRRTSKSTQSAPSVAG